MKSPAMKDPLPRPEPPRIWHVPPRGDVLVIAPHADDETCGCGGALALHAAQGDRVFIEILTAGTAGDPRRHYADIAARRLAEAQAAGRVLGADQVACWGLPDNHEVRRQDLEAAAERIAARLAETGARLLYHPWEGECHLDHRAAALAADRARELAGGGVRALGYEVWSPLPAGVVLDITRVRELKEQALSHYTSQLYYTDYPHHIFGLNAHRGIYLEGRARYGEAFLPAPGFFAAGEEG